MFPRKILTSPVGWEDFALLRKKSNCQQGLPILNHFLLLDRSFQWFLKAKDFCLSFNGVLIWGMCLCSQATGRNETKRMIRQIRCSIGMSGDQNPGCFIELHPVIIKLFTAQFYFNSQIYRNVSFCGESQTFHQLIFLNLEFFKNHWIFFHDTFGHCFVSLASAKHLRLMS